MSKYKVKLTTQPPMNTHKHLCHWNLMLSNEYGFLAAQSLRLSAALPHSAASFCSQIRMRQAQFFQTPEKQTHIHWTSSLLAEYQRKTAETTMSNCHNSKPITCSGSCDSLHTYPSHYLLQLTNCCI